MASSVDFCTSSLGEWRRLNVSNGLISGSVIPGIGGRVIDLSLGDRQIFYSNPRFRGKALTDSLESHWSLGRNYGGSKVWAAPQGWSSEQEWPGPPDPVLDCGDHRWQASIDQERGKIELESPHDEYTGLTMRREITISKATASVHVRHIMQNTSRRPVRWSIWQVTQVDAAHGLEIFVPATGFHQTFGDKPYGSVNHDPARKRLRIQYNDQVAKLAVEADEGWFAVLKSAEGLVFAETFGITVGARYPDNAPTAFWICGRGTFTLHGDQVDMSAGINGCDPHVETEIMSPLTDLEPGESYSFATAWHLAAIEASEIHSVSHCGAVGVPLAIDSSSSHITGSFGVFWEANLALLAYDRASRVVGQFDLGEVSPCRPVLLDDRISIPRNAVRCSLLMLDSHHRQLGVLDRANFC